MVQKSATPSTSKKHSFRQTQVWGSKPVPQSQFCKKTWTCRTSSPLCNEGAPLLIRMGGRLQAVRISLPSGGKLIGDDWIRNIIIRSSKIEFYSFPPPYFILSNVSLNLQKKVVLFLGTWSPDTSGSNYSSLEKWKVTWFLLETFLIPKAHIDVHQILALKIFNKFLWMQKFQMELGQSVVAYLQQGDVLRPVDIKHAYLHIPIFPFHQQFLWFAGEYWHFYFVALSFILSTASSVFTKVLAPGLGAPTDSWCSCHRLHGWLASEEAAPFTSGAQCDTNGENSWAVCMGSEFSEVSLSPNPKTGIFRSIGHGSLKSDPT